jgi:restriction system protein
MSVPDYQSLMLPVLKCISDGKEWRIGECADRTAEKLNLSQEDKETLLPSGKQTVLYNRIAWAVSYMEKAELIERSRRGYFRITSQGNTILEENPERIDIKTLSKFPKFDEWRKRSAENSSEAKNDNSTAIVQQQKNHLSPEEQIEQAYASIHAQLKADLLDNLTSELVSPSMFERIIVDLLIAMGYGGGRAEMGKALGRSGDGGVDGVIREDSLGLDVVYIQAKKYKFDSTIGREDIQKFSGSLDMFKATKGVFVTTSSFAKTAKEYVEQIHKRIVLIDGDRLAELMIRHNVGVRQKENYEVKKLDEDYFSE